MSAVTTVGRWRWTRSLLLLGLLFGVAAMHTALVPPSMGTDHAATTIHQAAEPPPAMTVGNQGSGHDTPHDTPGHPVGVHDLLHLCLAVLAAAFLLTALRAVLVALLPRRVLTVHVVSSLIVARPRPPPRTAVRLAQLCVLRT